MEIINKRLDLHAFKDYVNQYDFGLKLPNKLVIHHTWRPTKENWAGEPSIKGMKGYYEGKGWPAGPHLFVAEDGIWLFSPMQKDGIHASTLNSYSIGIEVVGDYDEKQWAGQTKLNALGVIKILMDRFQLSDSDIYFHRDVVSDKSCPGRAITKEWLFRELKNYRILPRVPARTPAMDQIERISAPLPQPSETENDIMIPLWAAEAVTWIQQSGLFEIKSQDDVRDAVKFHRFYKLINQNR